MIFDDSACAKAENIWSVISRMPRLKELTIGEDGTKPCWKWAWSGWLPDFAPDVGDRPCPFTFTTVRVLKLAIRLAHDQLPDLISSFKAAEIVHIDITGVDIPLLTSGLIYSPSLKELRLCGIAGRDNSRFCVLFQGLESKSFKSLMAIRQDIQYPMGVVHGQNYHLLAPYESQNFAKKLFKSLWCAMFEGPCKPI